MTETHYDADYYLRGPETGKSNYSDYSWKPDLTLPLADHLKRVMHIKDGDRVLDFGCARGYLVKALRMRGVEAFGYDSSKWAVENCDEGVKEWVSTVMPEGQFDHINFKDTAEHIHPAELAPLLERLIGSMRKSMLMIVPLTDEVNGPYLRPEDNADPSHIIRWPLQQWLHFVHRLVHMEDDVIVSGSWHYPGLKPASSEVFKSCGFIHFHRVS